MPFSLDKYRGRIKESHQRLRITQQFQEPDRVPMLISTGGSFYCSLFGYDIADYYNDLEVTLEVQLKGLEWAYEELQDDRSGAGLHPEIGPVAEAILFNAPIERPRGTSPWGRHIIHDPADIDRIQVPDPATHPGVEWVYNRVDEMRALAEKRGEPLPVSTGFGIHPPLSAACAITEPALIFEWMMTEPAQIRKLFDKLLEAFFRCTDYADQRHARVERASTVGLADERRTPARRESIGLADDHSAFVSDALYRELVMPYNLAIYERYGRKGRTFHADGPNDHHFATYANLLKLTQMDIGGFSDIANAKRELHGKTVMSGGLNCKDLYYDFETARPAVERAISIGAPGGGYIFAVGGETYAGVNPDTLIKTVAYAKEIGRYPIGRV